MGRALAVFGAAIVCAGIGVAIWDFSQRLSAGPGQECRSDEHCIAGNCLQLPSQRVCAEMCSGACDVGFRCVGVKVHHVNTPGLEGIGEMFYCLPTHLAETIEHTMPGTSGEPVEPTDLDTAGEESGEEEPE